MFLNCFDSYFLIPAVVEQIFNPVAELAIPIEIPIKQRSKSRNWNVSGNCGR